MGNPALKKRYHHGFWNRYLLSNLNTWLALPWTRLFVAVGLRPNQVTFLSFAASLAGAAIIAAVPGKGPASLGAALLIVGIIWDHSDGQVARITGKGSPLGALLDTVLDRWIELAWIGALAIAWARGYGPTLFDWPLWVMLAVFLLASHATLYVRWSNIQKDLYLLQQEIKASQSSPTTLEIRPTKFKDGFVPVTTFYLPFSFNRDVTLWMLFVITLSPAWDVGMAIFAIAHALRGLEKNWYTRGDLKRGDSNMVSAMLDPDYHK